MKLQDIVQQPHEVFESPQYTFPQEFGLDEPKQNITQTLSFLKDKNKTPIAKYSDGEFTMYEFPRMYLLVNHTDDYAPQTEYAMKFKLEFNKFLNRQTVQQIVVWRKLLSNFTNGLAKTIFLNELLPKYKTIITDAYQTQDGKRFWGNRIVEALGNGLFVYYINSLQPRTIKQTHSISELDNLVNNDKVWGDSQKFQAQRLVITSEKIDEHID